MVLGDRGLDACAFVGDPKGSVNGETGWKTGRESPSLEERDREVFAEEGEEGEGGKGDCIMPSRGKRGSFSIVNASFVRSSSRR